MAKTPSAAPSTKATAFDCLHCKAFARQNWGKVNVMWVSGSVTPDDNPNRFGGGSTVDNFWLAFCERCGRLSAWYEGRLIYPEQGLGPPSNADLPEDVRADYSEAQSIANHSPRGAAALLRLSIQKLCKQLGEPGENINADIASLVKNGLPARVQQALDVVRVIGNNAVHPGQIDLRDDRETAATLFELVNLIAQVMISEPKAVQEMYDKLPQSALDAISKRDQAEP